MRFTEYNDLIINEEFLDLLRRHGLDDFETLMNYESGDLFTEKPLRTVVRIELSDGREKKAFYLKRHYWSTGEKLKRLFRWGRPEDARNEWNNIMLLERCGFRTMTPVAYGERKVLGVPRSSLTVTEEIYGAATAEDYIPTLREEPPDMEKVLEKRELIRNIAGLAKEFHSKGFNHQDLYLCHVFVRPSSKELFLIDLQRVGQRKRPLRRWVVKDLAQIAYSAKNTKNFSAADIMRFAHAYFEKDKLDAEDKLMIREILSKARRIARHTEKIFERRAKSSG